MTRIMVDSTNVADDPQNVDMVAYYIDGIYATTEAVVRQRFPTQVLVSISAIGADAGVCGDVEPGCMTPQQAVIWVQQRRAAGVNPSLYVNETYGWAPARQAFIDAGVQEPVGWWVANYDGVAQVPAGAVAKQYENPPLDGGHFDKSVVADFWPGVDQGVDDVIIFRDQDNGDCRVPDGAAYRNINQQELQALQLPGGANLINLPNAVFAALPLWGDQQGSSRPLMDIQAQIDADSKATLAAVAAVKADLDQVMSTVVNSISTVSASVAALKGQEAALDTRVAKLENKPPVQLGPVSGFFFKLHL